VLGINFDLHQRFVDLLEVRVKEPDRLEIEALNKLFKCVQLPLARREVFEDLLSRSASGFVAKVLGLNLVVLVDANQDSYLVVSRV
jgi:hypothetical protein